MKPMNDTKHVLKEGFMVKKGHVRHNWKSRWFVLHSSTLSYYKAKGDIIPKGVIKLKGCSVISPDPEYIKKECVFRLIEILGTEYLLQCSNEIERGSWVQEIGEAIRTLDSLAKNNFIKISDRPSLGSASSSPSPNPNQYSIDEPMLVILQNRVTHEDLMTAMQDTEAGITLCNHHIGNEVYKLCCSGEEMVTWLVSWSFVKSREEGRIIAGGLLEKAYLQPLGPVSETSAKRKVARKQFCDTNDVLYRFSTLTLNNGLDVEFDISDSSDESDDEPILQDLQATVVKQGFLVKKGHVRHKWRVQKFVLCDEPIRLSYFSPTKGTKVKKGQIKLFGSEIRALNEEEDKHDTSCAKGCKNVIREHCFLIRTKKGSKYVLQAPSEDEMNDWLKLLQQSIIKYENFDNQ